MPTETIQAIPLDKFEADQLVRSALNEELVAQIAQSLQTVGQLQPVRARWLDGRLAMVDGHHRLAAAKRAGLQTLDTIIEDKDLSAGEVIQRQLILNCQREDLSPLEKACGIKQLMEVSNWTANQAAAALGFSNATVTRLLKLLELPAAIVQQVEAGKIAPSAAYELAQIEDPDQQADLAAQLASGRLTRDRLSGIRKAKRNGGSEKGNRGVSRATLSLGPDSSITVVNTDLTLGRLIELTEDLLAKARRCRTQGLELDTFRKMLRDQSRPAEG